MKEAGGDARPAKAAGNRIRQRIEWEPSNSNVFVTKPGPFTDLVVEAIQEVTGRKPDSNTGGGTSDARFISHYCPVLEFGLVGQTMHQVDERVAGERSRTIRLRFIAARWSGISPTRRRCERRIVTEYGSPRRRQRSQLSIVDPHEIEAVGRSDRAAGGAIRGLERICEIIRGPAAFADGLQRADHRAHLAVQERARGG